MTGKTLDGDGTEPTTTTTQEPKTFTQEEFDAAMKRTRESVEHKIAKKYSAYEELGSLEELQELRTLADKAKRKKMEEKGEFDKILAETVSKKDAAIKALQSEIEGYKINTPLLNAASELKLHNPSQVAKLLREQVRLSNEGDVEVVDSEGKVRYNTDSGQPFSIAELVREFSDSNPFYVSANPATTNTRGNVRVGANNVAIGSLDMSKPENREKARKAGYFR